MWTGSCCPGVLQHQRAALAKGTYGSNPESQEGRPTQGSERMALALFIRVN